MTKIAIDIVLLPSPAVADMAIAINKGLNARVDNPKVVLGHDTAIPHISLCMGVIREEDTEKVAQIVKQIAQHFTPLQLEVTGTRVAHPVEGETFSMWQISHTDAIQSLHEQIMQEVWPYVSYDDISADMYANPEQVEPISFYWVERYAKKYDDPASFHPHLSLGVGEADQPSEKISFTASALAVCQLGNYCTCRKVVSRTELAAT